MSEQSGFDAGFSRKVEAILNTVQLGAAMQEVYLYPHEVRENLRLAGMRLDGALSLLPDFDGINIPEDHEPDFGPEVEDEEYEVGLNEEDE